MEVGKRKVGEKMRKSLKERALKFARSSTYPYNVSFTRKAPFIDSRMKGARYYFIFPQSYSVWVWFKTQNELSEFLEIYGF